MFDLSTLDTNDAAEAGARMEVTHPTTGAPLMNGSTAIVLILAGQDSDRYRAADRKISNKRIATGRNGQRLVLTAESIESDNLQRLVACTIGWEGVAWDGAEKDCTPENARALYERFPFMREQAETFIADRANFLKA
jgi:hypothetical protein